MMKAFFTLVVIGGMVQVARSDFQCFMDKLLDMNRSGVFIDKTDFCRHVPSLVEEMLKYAKACSFAFDGDAVKDILLEFCDENSELFRSINENEECLLEKWVAVGGSCSQNLIVLPGRSAAENCERLKLSFLRCYEENVGAPCGERALQGVRRMLGIPKAMLAGLCDEVESESPAERYRRIRWYIIIGVGVASLLCTGLVKLCKTYSTDKKKKISTTYMSKPV